MRLLFVVLSLVLVACDRSALVGGPPAASPAPTFRSLTPEVTTPAAPTAPVAPVDSATKIRGLEVEFVQIATAPTELAPAMTFTYPQLDRLENTEHPQIKRDRCDRCDRCGATWEVLTCFDRSGQRCAVWGKDANGVSRCVFRGCVTCLATTLADYARVTSRDLVGRDR